MAHTLEPTSEETRVYEIAILLPGDGADKEKSESLRNIAELFKEKEVTILKKDEWKRMGLAYKIKGQETGQYVIFYVSAKPEVLKDIDQQLKIERGVLRHLVIKLPPKYEVVDWSLHFTAWKEGLAKEEEARGHDREEELKKKIVQRATRKVLKPEKPAELRPAEPGAEISTEELSEKLGELISDENLNL
ncbi:MAG TPA: 30S ribosomal protein S6 [Candidatus Peribacterales bacterium]|nr:30S ribosomal protein S6 [Candidatus Peribacterales bacterium]